MTKNTTPLEHDECVLLADYLRLKKLRFTHIPNETYTKSLKQKRKNKEAGVARGVPDYLIFVDRHQSKHDYPFLMFIEMKRRKGSATSPEQIAWLTDLNKVVNVGAFLCKGFDQARKVIDDNVK